MHFFLNGGGGVDLYSYLCLNIRRTTLYPIILLSNDRKQLDKTISSALNLLNVIVYVATLLLLNCLSVIRLLCHID